jgi:hypothetical protein
MDEDTLVQIYFNYGSGTTITVPAIKTRSTTHLTMVVSCLRSASYWITVDLWQR